MKLASFYFHLEKPDKAETFYELALVRFKRRKEAKDPNTYYVMMRLGVVYKKRNSNHKAREIWVAALSGLENNIGLDHEWVPIICEGLSGIMEELGKHKESDDMMVKAHEGYMKVLGPENPHTIRTAEPARNIHNSRAAGHQRLKERAASSNLQLTTTSQPQHASLNMSPMSSPGHETVPRSGRTSAASSTRTSPRDGTTSQHHWSNTTAATSTYSLDFRMKTATSLKSSSSPYSPQSSTTDKDTANRSPEVGVKVSDESSMNALEKAVGQGVIFYEGGDYAAARTCLEQALKGRSKVYEHDKLALVGMFYLGMTLRKLEKPREAIGALKKAIDHQAKNITASSLDCLLAVMELGDVYYYQRDLEPPKSSTEQPSMRTETFMAASIKLQYQP